MVEGETELYKDQGLTVFEDLFPVQNISKSD